MNTPRRVLMAAALLLSYMLERWAFYATRAVLVLWMTNDLNLSVEDSFEFYAMAFGASAFAPLLGGLVAIGVGPRITGALGATVAALGYAVLAATDTGPPFLGVGLMVVGSGLFRPAIFVALAEEFAYPEGNARNAVFLLSYLAINVAAMLGPLGGGLIGESGGAGVAFGVSAGASFVASLLAGGALAAHHWVGSKPKRRTFGGRPVLGAATLLVLMLPYYVGINALSDLLFAAMQAVGPGVPLFMSLNPAIVGIVVLIMAAVFGVLAFRKARPQTLHFVGGGLLVFSLGLGAGAAANPESGLGGLLLVAIIVTAVGEGIIGALLLSRVAADAPHRLGTLVFSLFLVLSGSVSAVREFAANLVPGSVILAISAFLALVAGAVVLAFARPMERFFYTPADEPSEAAQPDVSG